MGVIVTGLNNTKLARLEFDVTISCLAVALQVRGNSEHASIYRGRTRIVASCLAQTWTPRVGFDLTDAPVCSFALVFGRLMGR